ncbi:MAG TPA: MlaD family protein [Methylococcaceae bacterium]|nr:MlaD family protein [Methylococcaceae bacterium]
MSGKTNPALVGAFFLGALALLIGGILIFSQGAFKHLPHYIVYFDESVNGLNVGAPVKLRGANVGKVVNVVVMSDQHGARVVTPVIIELDPSTILDFEGQPLKTIHRSAEELARLGLRAQLNLQSLVTGQLYIELDFHPAKRPRFLGENMAYHPYPEIPSIPSSKEEISNTVGEALGEIRKLPVQEVAQATLKTLQHIEQILASQDSQELPTSLNKSAKDLDELVLNLNAQTTRLTASLDETLKEANLLMRNANSQLGPALNATAGAMEEARTALASVNDKPLQASVERALEELARAARSITVLADYLQRDPNAVLVGKTNPKE